MNKILRSEYAIPVILAFVVISWNQESETNNIRAVLDEQVKAWNKGDIDQFMDGYWKSDSLAFVGSGITSGWKATLDRYKKSYPDRDAMGTLRFELLRFQKISSDAYLITGKFVLTRKQDNPHGIFTLLFRKIEGKWVVAYDHTSSQS